MTEIRDSTNNRIRPDDEDSLFHYLNLNSFISLLQTSAIHIRRLDKFPQDDFEATKTKIEIEQRSKELRTLFREPHDYKSLAQMENGLNKSYRQKIFAHCWHLSSHESTMHWNQYAPNSSDIAIKSKVINLSKAINYKEGFRILKIKYEDFDDPNSSRLPNPYSLTELGTRKRIEYSVENEVRLIINAYLDLFPDIAEDGSVTSLNIPEFLKIEVDLELMIEEIRINPNSPNWQFNMVKELIRKYGFDIKVSLSTLSNKSFSL